MKANEAKALQDRRWDYPLKIARWWQAHMRDRVNATRTLFGKPSFLRGDCHCHTIHSDGIGTVEMMYQMKDAAGLDFLFITDHRGITQKRECVRFPNLWWGQEPPTQYHHIGILDGVKKYVVKKDLMADLAAARKIGKLVFIAHPTGWYPTTRYNQDQMEVLFSVDDEFNMEIINGANQMFDCFDVTDDSSVQLWDKLLCAGKRVHAMGNTDAHLPHCIGSVWNGVFRSRLEKREVIRALGRGRNFVSEAPCIDLLASSGGRRAQMGESLRVKGNKATIHIRVADSFGLQALRIVQDGRVKKEIDLRGKTNALINVPLKISRRSRYVRVECNARDWRRAYTNPVYFRS